MPQIPVTSVFGYIGIFFLLSGAFLVLAGLRILVIQKISVKPGKQTWGFGIFLAIFGLLFLLPEINSSFTKSVFTVTPTPTTFAETVNLPGMSILPTNTHGAQISTPVSIETQSVIFRDEFNSNMEGWSEFDNENDVIGVKHQIVNGKYRDTLLLKGTPWLNWSPLVPGVLEGDFELTVEASIVEAADLNGVSVLISFRNSKDHSNLYLVYFSNNGAKTLVRKNNEWFTVHDWVVSNDFKLEIGKPNIFGVLVKGTDISIFANGHKLKSSKDDTLNVFGGIGLGVGVELEESSNQKIIVEFDNLVIKDVR